jgi:hypothetical protein
LDKVLFIEYGDVLALQVRVGHGAREAHHVAS